VACVAPSVVPQPTASVEPELTAIRTALGRQGWSHAGLSVVINPMMVKEGHAPGGEPAGLRDPDKNAAIAKALGARSLPRSEANIAGGDLYVSLSEPRLEGKNTVVTVTVWGRGRRRGLTYETIHLTLTPEGDGWKVVSLEQLGIS
jgi:hypothetical protein